MEETEFDSLEDLKLAVDEVGGTLSMYMWTLRDAYGANRLGTNVRKNISKKLHSFGLEHLPRDLPDSQWGKVRIFKQGTTIAELIVAAITPSKENDELLRQRAGSEAQNILNKVRELVEV